MTEKEPISPIRGNLIAMGGVVETKTKIIWLDVVPLGCTVIADSGEHYNEKQKEDKCPLLTKS